MQTIRAGLHSVVDVATARLAIFRSVVTGLNGHFLDGVRSLLVHLGELLPETVARILALYVDGLGAGRHAIYAQRVVGCEVGPRHQLQRSQRVPDISQPAAVPETGRRAAKRENWKLVQGFRGGGVAYLGAFGFKHGR